MFIIIIYTYKNDLGPKAKRESVPLVCVMKYIYIYISVCTPKGRLVTLKQRWSLLSGNTHQTAPNSNALVEKGKGDVTAAMQRCIVQQVG